MYVLNKDKLIVTTHFTTIFNSVYHGILIYMYV